jgi:penicillin-binding protein 1A
MSNISKLFLIKRYQKSKRKNLELLNFVIFIFVFTFSIITLSVLGQLKTYASEIPTEEKIKAGLVNKGENSKIYDRNGVLLYTFKDPERDREYVEYENIPRTVVAAALAAEDKDFFIHEGIDYLGALKGVVSTVSTEGENTRGGSTITQQLIKQTLLSSEQTVERKIKEAMLAMLVERDYEKEQILEYYLNVSNYGGRIQGIKTAAKSYFNKDLKNITLNEACFLVGLVQSPGKYSPLYAVDKEEAKRLSDDRRKTILDQLVANPKLIAYLNSGEKSYLVSKPGEPIDIKAGLLKPTYTVQNITQMKKKDFTFSKPKEELRAPHWVFYIRQILRLDPYDVSVEELYSGGLSIYTSLDIRVQDLAQSKIKEGVDLWGGTYGFENSAAVSIDPRNGEILAMVGSKGYDLPNDPNDRRFDPEVNVTLSRQTLGSSLKPWVAYLAFDSGRYSPYSIVKDSPQRFYGYYKPKNFDGKFYGNMSIRKALLDSRNLPFIKLLYKMGDWRLGELMEEVGYRKDNEYGLASAVGGVDESLLDHTAAYAALANGGEVKNIKPVLKILGPDGQAVFTAEDKVLKELNRGAVGEVNHILGDKGYTPHTYIYKFIGGNKLAGKTGTSDANKDTYYMGYGPRIVTGIWCGNNDNARMSSRALGSTTALRVWNNYMSAFFNDFPEYQEQGSY